MQRHLEIEWGNQHWTLDASGACYLPAYHTLIISDFHIGKVQHFRKHGIAVPLAAAKANLSKLEWAIAKYTPKRLLFLGDLFHSDANSEISILQHIRLLYPNMEMQLVPGNHDLHSLTLQAGIFTIAPVQYVLAGITFQHHPPETEALVPTMHGHWHPAFSMRGKGRQRLRLACFAFSENTAVLPAFGLFTGKADLPEKLDWQKIAVISKEGVFQVPQHMQR